LNKIEIEKHIDEMLQAIADTRMMLFRDHHINTSGDRMSFDSMPYMKQIYEEISRRIRLMGAAQNGKTDWATIDCLSMLGLGLNTFHVFSDAVSKQKYFNTRVNFLCDRVPLYAEMEVNGKYRRNMNARRMGASNWLYAISGSKTTFSSDPADVVVVDEYDECNKENTMMAWDRIQNSPYKFDRLLANPTVANQGIALQMEESKYYVYHWECDECGEMIPPDFFKVVCHDVIDKEGNHLGYELYDTEWHDGIDRDIYIRCPHCNHLQTREKWDENTYRGKWIAKYPEKEIAGYWIPLILKLDTQISELWHDLKISEHDIVQMQWFYNKRLGLPYEGHGAKITSDMIHRSMGEYNTLQSYTEEHGAVAGVDVGAYYDMQIDVHVQTEEKERKKMTLWAGRCESLDDVESRIKQYNVKLAVFDSQPEYNAVREFQSDMYGKCRVALCQIMKARTGKLKIMGVDWDRDNDIVKVDRDWLLTESQRMWQNNICIVPKDYKSLANGFWEDSLVSITKYKDEKEDIYTWSKAEGKDHFRFSDAFAMLAWMEKKEIIIIGDLDFVRAKLESEGHSEEDIERGVQRVADEGYKEEDVLQYRFGFRNRRKR